MAMKSRTDAKNISIIGAGYAYLVTTACLAELGNKITMIEIDSRKLAGLESGRLPVKEPGLPDLWKRNREGGRINITPSYTEGLRGADFAFIALGAPSGRNGKPDLKWIRTATRSIAEAASGSLIVVLKSTVPVGTADVVSDIIAQHSRNGYQFAVVSNPDFLREGMAVQDFMKPSRIVVGGFDRNDIEAVAALYAGLDSPLITCDNKTAEMSKYVSNTFQATKISFINEIALLCDECGADVKKVAEIASMEPRHGHSEMNAGLGWGGSSLPRDVRGLIYMAETYRVPLPLMHAVQRVNQRQPRLVVDKLRSLAGSLQDKTIGILGLAFKPGSSDMLEARSVEVIRLLEDAGCRIKAYDPLAMEEATKIMPMVTYCEDAYKVASGSDALILVTECDEFKELNLKKMASLMARPVMVDSRNLYNPEEMIRAGFLYDGIGHRITGEKISGAALLTETMNDSAVDITR
jgi:UDPglucose 6-dehydrogenase